METKLETPTAPPPPSSGPQKPLDAAYCGPEPDFTEIAAMFARGGFPL